MNIPIYNLVSKHLNKSKSVFLIQIVDFGGKPPILDPLCPKEWPKGK